jgi:glucose-6-phosphate isomerase
MGDHHELLVANALAQAQALAFGATEDQVRAQGTPEALVPHKVMPGNRPSSLLLAEVLDPFRLGALVALYEHVVFVQGVVWGVNSFDQWGVELGKVLAGRIVGDLAPGREPELGHDPSTDELIRTYRRLRDGGGHAGGGGDTGSDGA